MILYELMREYAKENPSQTESECLTPELGGSLSLLHSSLIDCDLKNEQRGDRLHLIASPNEITPLHLSHFVVAYLPLNFATTKPEINHILFDVYSFFGWMDKNKIYHGLAKTNIPELLKQLCAKQERCLKLNQVLGDESERVLKNPPSIKNTLNDVFLVEKIEQNAVSLKGQYYNEIVQLRLPPDALTLIQLNDYLDLILGDTSEKWVVLEASQVYPEAEEL